MSTEHVYISNESTSVRTENHLNIYVSGCKFSTEQLNMKSLSVDKDIITIATNILRKYNICGAEHM